MMDVTISLVRAAVMSYVIIEHDVTQELRLQERTPVAEDGGHRNPGRRDRP
jgi:hypothetical protein